MTEKQIVHSKPGVVWGVLAAVIVVAGIVAWQFFGKTEQTAQSVPKKPAPAQVVTEKKVPPVPPAVPEASEQKAPEEKKLAPEPSPEKKVATTPQSASSAPAVATASKVQKKSPAKKSLKKKLPTKAEVAKKTYSHKVRTHAKAKRPAPLKGKATIQAATTRFEKFAGFWVEKISRNLRFTRSKMNIRQESGVWVASFVSVPKTNLSMKVKPSPSGICPYVGILRYREEIFEARGDSRESVAQGPFRQVKTRRVTEIFRFDKGRWKN